VLAELSFVSIDTSSTDRHQPALPEISLEGRDHRTVLLIVIRQRLASRFGLQEVAALRSFSRSKGSANPLAVSPALNNVSFNSPQERR